MMRVTDSPMEMAQVEHPTQDTEPRHRIDARLHRRGFAILSRPASGEPVWTRCGVQFRQAEAMLRCQDQDQDQDQNAEKKADA